MSIQGVLPFYFTLAGMRLRSKPGIYHMGKERS